MCQYLYALHLNPIAAIRAHGLQKLSYQSAELLGQVLPSAFFIFTAFSSITLVYSRVYWYYNTTLLEINSKIGLSLLTLNMPFSFTMHHSFLFSTVATLKMPRHLLKICFQTIRKQLNVAACMEQPLSPGIK